MAMPEVYLALKTGSIDGQENPLTIMSAAKYFEVTEQVVLTGHLVQPVFYALRKQVWDGLSDDLKSNPGGRRQRDGVQQRRQARRRKAGDRAPQGSRPDDHSLDLKPFLDHADKVYAAPTSPRPGIRT